jgi:thiamine kinase-like enzyme
LIFRASDGDAIAVVERPESALDPDLAAAIRAIPAWAGRGPDAVAPLPGGLTNRNFRVDLGGAAYVVRIPGKDTALLGIDRRAEWEATQAAAAAGVGPEPVAFLPDRGILVTRFLAADPLPADALARGDVLADVVTAIRTLHAMPAIPSSFSPFRVVRDYRRLAAERDVPIPRAFEEARAAADEVERACGARPVPAVPCHNDLLSANFLHRDGRVFIVDYEYAGMGDPFFDLGNFAVNHDLPEDAQQVVLARYAGRASRGALARLRLMGIVSDFREAMWGVVQQGLSTLSVDYHAYAERHLERGLRAARDVRWRRWLADAASGDHDE